MSVFVTGASGLIGSALTRDVGESLQLVTNPINSTSGFIDILDKTQLATAFEAAKPEVVVHLAAYTDVTGAWHQQGDKSGSCYLTNVVGTQNIVEQVNEYDAHLVHISTAFVFDGTKKEKYLESDAVNPIEWYGHTKAMAEEIVLDSKISATILRIDKPFSLYAGVRPDILRLVLSGLRNNNLYPQFTNHYFGPTVIEEFNQVLMWAIENKPQGIYHASSGESWSDFDFATKIAQAFDITIPIAAGDLTEYLKTLNRPYQQNTALDCSKLFSEFRQPETSVAKAIELSALQSN